MFAEVRIVCVIDLLINRRKPKYRAYKNDLMASEGKFLGNRLRTSFNNG